MTQEFIGGIHQLKAKATPCVATIGSFDGVHKGHQVLLAEVIARAKTMSLPSAVMLFEPQPYEYFSKHDAPPRLMRLREKVTALFEQGVDRVVCLRFNHWLRSLPPQAYVSEVLVQALQVKSLVVGDDFRFGKNRAGDFSLLRAMSMREGFDVVDTPTHLMDTDRVSSTRIRKLLAKGLFEQAQALLGRPYSMMGRVCYGKQLGRKIGFPTMNVGLGRYCSPLNGVYAVTVKLVGRGESVELPAIANIGKRPTVEDSQNTLLEVFVFNANLNVYGEFINVTVKKKIRDEMAFSDIDALTAQIQKDAASVEAFFN